MSEPNKDAAEKLAWATLTTKVADIDATVNALQSEVYAAFQQITTHVGTLSQVVRMTRNETPEQFQLAMARAQRIMSAPPESTEVEALRQEVEQLRKMFAEATRPVEAVELAKQPQPRKRSKVVPQANVSGFSAPERPRPEDFAPAVVVQPPGLRSDDDLNIPLREQPFVTPPGMSFGEPR